MGWLSGWSYRKSHVIAGTAAGAQTDYPVKVVVHYGAGVDAGEDVYCNSLCQTDFDDVRFAKPDGTELDYWRESYTDSVSAVFWVEVDSIPASPGNVTIHLYYGNGAVGTTSNGENTFSLFEDFPGVALDPAKWTSGASGGTSSVTVAGGIVYIKSDPSGPPGGYAYIKSVNQWGTGYAIRALASYAPHSASYVQFVGIAWSSFDGGSYPIWGSSDMLTHILRGSAYEWQAYRKDGAALVYQNCAITESTWQKYENRRTESGSALFQVLEEGGASTSYGAGWETAALYIGASVEQSGGSNNRTTSIDWILVRKFVTAEPSHGSWGPQTSEGSPLNLKAGFFVNALMSSSRDLICGFGAYRPGSQSLSVVFIVRGIASGELGSQFEVGQGQIELSTEFIVRHASSSALKAGFKGQAVQVLSMELRVRHSGSRALLGHLNVRHSNYGSISGQFIVRHGDERSLLGHFSVRHENSLPVLSHLTARHSGLLVLSAGMSVRHYATHDLLGGFIGRHSASRDMRSGFSGQAVRLLSSEFIVRHAASSGLLGETLVRHSDNIEAPGQFIVRHSNSRSFRAGLNIVHWRSLLSNFIARHYDISDLAMGFFVNQYNAQTNLRAGFYAFTLNLQLPSQFYVRPLESRAIELIIEDLTRGLTIEDLDRELIIKGRGRRLKID